MATKIETARDALQQAEHRVRLARIFLEQCSAVQEAAQEHEQWTRLEALDANTADAENDLRVALAAQDQARQELDALPTPIDAGEPADGWNKEARDRLGITELVAKFEGISYELCNAQRGSYELGGDTAGALLEELTELRDMLDSVLTALGEEAGV